MKILFISENYPPYVEGGAEISTSLLAGWLVRQGHDVTVACCKFNDKSWIEGGATVYPIIRRASLGSKDFVSAIKYALDIVITPITSSVRVLQLIRKTSPDVVNIVVTVYHFIPIIFFIKLFSRRPIFVDCRDYSLICPVQFKNNEVNDPLRTDHGYRCLSRGYEISNRFMLLFAKIFAIYESFVFNSYKSGLRWLLNHSKKITLVANSEYVRKQLTLNGFPKDKIAFIYNISQSTEVSKTDLAKSTTPTFTYGGRIEKEKGVWDLITAAELLHTQSKKPFSLKIAGIGSELGGVRKYVEKNELNYISVLGLIPRDKLLALYQQSLAIIAPSCWPEPFGRFILEARSVGKPVISTRTGGTQEGVIDGVTGKLVDFGNIEQLKMAMQYFIENPEQSSIMGSEMKNGQRDFDADVIGNKRLELYKK